MRVEQEEVRGDRVAARVRAGLEEILGIDRLQPADVAEEPDGTAVAVLVVGLAVIVERVAESGVQRAENLVGGVRSHQLGADVAREQEVGRYWRASRRVAEDNEPPFQQGRQIGWFG